MQDFWRSSGYPLLERDADGWLAVTDDFLRAYLLRPEMLPVEESCDNERALHAALLDDPRLIVPPAGITALADPDARENYQLVLAFRDRLVASGTLERCYMGLFSGERVPVPPLFVDQLARVILRNVLDGTDDPFLARAGELFFRQQKVSLQNGAVLLADADTIETHAITGGLGNIGRLLAEAQTRISSTALHVLNEDNAGNYWQGDERHDTVLNISFEQRGLHALCRVLEAWVGHFLKTEIGIQPVRSISDERWIWHLGLDSEASAILNDLYNDADVDDLRRTRILALFRLEFRDPSLVMPKVAGRPVHVAMAMTRENTLRLKPQNLLVNLPLAASA
jgi:hypothetical protein